ncbi:MAG: glycosyltransferase, partial [Actinobacteria bacterium]|nr:glycosyltransferase [Actinomycetota bacterium]
LESVRDQTLPPCEVIVVDDGSTDRTIEIGHAFQARVIANDGRGVSAARNTGIAASRGDVIAFLDHDDLWEPRKLERQVACLEEHPEVSIVFCSVGAFVEPGAQPVSWLKAESLSGSDNPMAMPSTLAVRRATFEAIGGFADVLDIAEDLDWTLRVRDAGLVSRRIEEQLVRYRIHGENTTAIVSPSPFPYLRVLRASIERRRSAAGRGIRAG